MFKLPKDRCMELRSSGKLVILIAREPRYKLRGMRSLLDSRCLFFLGSSVRRSAKHVVLLCRPEIRGITQHFPSPRNRARPCLLQFFCCSMLRVYAMRHAQSSRPSRPAQGYVKSKNTWGCFTEESGAGGLLQYPPQTRPRYPEHICGLGPSPSVHIGHFAGTTAVGN